MTDTRQLARTEFIRELRDSAIAMQTVGSALRRSVQLLGDLKKTLELPFHPLADTRIQDGWEQSKKAGSLLAQAAAEIERLDALVDCLRRTE